MNLRDRSFALAALVTFVVAAAPAFAQETLETPSVVVTGQKPSSVRLMVTAGLSGAPNGFAVDWMRKADFDVLGGWPADNSGPMTTSRFVGIPTYNTEGTAAGYELSPGSSIEVELGQLFDETGVISDFVDELNASTQYVVRVRALGDVGSSPSVDTQTMTVVSGQPQTNCTYTWGYWKNHPEVWPVGSLTLGTVNYTAAELVQILGEPAAGNGLLQLAHQLIAAKLNILNGANPAAISATISAAEAQIGGLICPPLVGAGYLDPASVSAKVQTLDDYNNGVIGPGHCGTVPAAATTWGSVKSMYRQ